ncbi:MAG: hypothetical protein ACLUG5_02465 [Clostridia bacterium]|jgi:hypothetical protein|uniref:hypothetical protein n=1 Tax=Candidatus Merdicola sp. TaxID=3085652 RepID=UPI000A65CE06
MSVLMERTLLLTVNMLIIPIAMVNRLTKSEKPLQKLKNYINVMLLLTTHRLELAEDLATKRYNITKDGTLEQIPIKHKEQYEEFSK